MDIQRNWRLAKRLSRARVVVCFLTAATLSLALIPLHAGAASQARTGLSSNASVFATGLNNPRGLKFGPDGYLYVAECGTGGSSPGSGRQVVPPVGPYTGGKTASISKISRTGVRTLVVGGLPSTVGSPKAGRLIGGVGDVEFIGTTLYALLFGGGASHGNPDTPNAIIRINTDRSITTIANLSKYLRAHPVAVPDPGDFEPDGTWYSMVHAGQNLYAVEPNHAELDRITLDGHVSRVLDFSAIIGSLTPTAMTVGPDGNFYIGNLTEIPYLDGLAHIFRVTPHGQISVAASGLTTVLGVAFDRQGRLYALETSTHNLGHPPFMQPGTGAVVRISASGGVQTIATGLTFPTAMTIGPDGNLYVSNFGYNGKPGQGQIVRISLSRRYCSSPARICPAP